MSERKMVDRIQEIDIEGMKIDKLIDYLYKICNALGLDITKVTFGSDAGYNNVSHEIYFQTLETEDEYNQRISKETDSKLARKRRYHKIKAELEELEKEFG